MLVLKLKNLISLNINLFRKDRFIVKKVRVSSANNLLRYSLGYILDFYKICVSPYINSECSYVETCSSFSKRMILEKGLLLVYF